MKPQRPYRALRAFVGTVVLLVTFGLWAYAQLSGQGLGTLWDVVALAIVIAAGYAVFGKRTFGAALEEAQDVQGGDDDDQS